ncbi:MAG: hypothetical protein A3G21_05590 [Acidobacteria bacterium RIFCSPLOWO2_12_FULL_66_21]|nr:MAG: hypothetical protein A3G21_05590 [Acidobacteria bacterium RIFCSPLOWO2_12_FULL_66_21]
MSPYRTQLYRLVFAAAAVYNVAFGLWAALRPRSFFDWFDLVAPLYPSIWACLGMVVGLYGLGYAYAARHLDRAAPFIAIGLAGKLLGPAGWVLAVRSGEWPIRTVALVLFNDAIWWVPFALFLLEGTRAAAALRRSAPYVCAVVNLAALVAMATALRAGTEMVPAASDRIAYVLAHPVTWRAGWALWMAAAVSLVAFYAWWADYVEERAWALAALAIATVGLAGDLAGEALLIGWVPRDYQRVAPLATLLTGAVANGLYTVAGIILTLKTPSLPRSVRLLAWSAWTAGACVTVATLARAPFAIAIATTLLFLSFCPYAVLLGRDLNARTNAES